MKMPRRSVGLLMRRRIDSAVAAFLLKQNNLAVTGLSVHHPFLTNEANEANDEFTEDTCRKLNIPWSTIQLGSESYNDLKREVKRVLSKGWNTDLNILFHKFITFGEVFHHVHYISGFDFFATPHYLRTDLGYNFDEHRQVQGVKLLRGIDQLHDDSFSLCQVQQKVLQKCLFPLGEFSSDIVHKISKSLNLPSPVRCSSQNDRAITTSHIKQFVVQDSAMDSKLAKIINLENRKYLTQLRDFHDFEPGDRVNVGNQELFVAEKNISTGNIIVVPGINHPALMTQTLFTALANWTHTTPHHFYTDQQMMDVEFRTRRDERLAKCTLTVGNMYEYCGNNHIILSSPQLLRAVVPGHYCAFYQGEEMIGGAQIVKAGPSEYAMNYRKSQDTASRRRQGGGSTPFSSLLEKLRFFHGSTR